MHVFSCEQNELIWTGQGGVLHGWATRLSDVSLESAHHGGLNDIDLKVHFGVHFKVLSKMHKKVTKRMRLTLDLMVYLRVHLLVEMRTH